MMLRIRLGGIMQNATESDVPSCCNKPFSNAIASGGHYHSACLLCAKERTERHDYVRDCILRMAKEAGMTPRLEANGVR